MKITHTLVAVFAFAFAPAMRAQGTGASVQGTIGSALGGQVSIATAMPQQPGAPAGAISGIVVDENNSPIPNAMVQASLEMTMPDGIRRPMSSSSRPTDQNGHFTLERLQPGEYTVAVIPFGMRQYAPSEQMTYEVTFFPGVTDLAQAQRVTAVEAGGKPITIRVRRSPAFHVRGTVVSPSGRSPVGLSVQLTQKVFNSTFPRATAIVRPDGSFDLGGAGPGVYTLSTRVGSGGYSDANADFAVAEITVKDRDLAGVRLNLVSGGTIHGRLVVEKAPRSAAPLGLVVQAMPGNVSQMGNSIGRMPVSAPVAADWTFDVRGLYGQYRFNLQTQGLPDYALVRTVLDGRDIGNALDVSITTGKHELVFYLAHR